VCLFNGSNEFYLTKAMVTPLGSIFGAQFLYVCSQKTINSIEVFFRIVALTVFIESILCVCIHFIPGADSLYTSIFVPSGGAADLNDIAAHYRLVGIGNAVAFGALPSYMLGLFSAVYLISTSKNNIDAITFLLIYATIILVTFLVVRTSIIISAISLFSLFLLSNNNKTTILWIILSLVVFSIIAISLISTYVDSQMFEWAFGFLISKDVDSGTQGRVLEWYQTIHFDIKTLIIGDGMYENPNGGYYGDTDVGFFRQIYYGGIIGLSLMLYYHYKILKYSYFCNPHAHFKVILILFFVSLLIFLAKGDLNLLSGFILVLVFVDKGIFEKKYYS
jgi:hypothetical protein